jgi:hypothetical protein
MTPNPELLHLATETLELLQRRLEAACAQRDDLLAALQRVIGSACLHPDDMDGQAKDAVSAARAAIAKANGEPS